MSFWMTVNSVSVRARSPASAGNPDTSDWSRDTVSVRMISGARPAGYPSAKVYSAKYFRWLSCIREASPGSSSGKSAK